MNKKFFPRLVYKFLFRSRSIGVLPWLTLFALTSVGVGVATLILVLSVMNGFSTAIQEQLVDIYSPMRVYPADRKRLSLKTTEEVLSSYVDSNKLVGVFEGEVLLKSTRNRYQGGRILSFTQWKDQRLNLKRPTGHGIHLGEGLAQGLLVFPGDEVTIIRPNAQGTPFGMLPGGRTRQVKGLFRTGYQQFDRFLGIVTWSTARQIFNLQENHASYVEVWLDDRQRASDLKSSLREKFSEQYRFVTWKEASPAMFEALQLERTVTFIVLTLIVLVAAINILSMLVLSILQRRKQIGMMMAMGATPGRILRLFMVAGLSITIAGLLIGIVIGTGGAYLLDNVFVIQLPPVYPLRQLPVKVSLFHLLLIAVVTLLLGGLSSFYPAWKASRIDPARVLRYG